MKKPVSSGHIRLSHAAAKGLAVVASLIGILAVPADAALIAYYDFENDTLDASGNGSHGTNNGVNFSSTVPTALGHSTRSGNFEGGSSGDHVDLGDLGIFDQAQATGVTISFWVRPDVASQNAWIFAEGNDSNSNTAYVWGTRTASDGKVHNFIRNNNLSVNQTSAGTADAFLVGEWHHVLITDLAGSVSLYVDGSVDTAGSTALSYTPSGTFTFQNSAIGAWIRGSSPSPTINNQFDGLIDDVAIYDEVLGSSQISALASGTNPIPEPTSAFLAALGGFAMAVRRKRA